MFTVQTEEVIATAALPDYNPEVLKRGEGLQTGAMAHPCLARYFAPRQGMDDVLQHPQNGNMRPGGKNAIKNLMQHHGAPLEWIL
jgi:hypothetical protein